MKFYPKTKQTWLQYAVLLIFTIIITIIIAGCLFSQPLSIPSGKLIRSQLKLTTAGPFKVGDIIPLTLTIETRNKVTYQLPDLTTNLESTGLELQNTESEKIEKFSQGLRQIINYQLIGWQTGKYSIPSLTISYQDSTGLVQNYPLPEIKLEIVSVLPKYKSEADLLALDIQPVKPPVNLLPNYQNLLLFFVILLVLYFIWWIYLKFTKEPVPIEVQPEAPAHIIALRRLEILKATDYLTKSDFKTYYSELSECIREYIENRYQIRALEMTTEEFLIFLTTNNLLDHSNQLMLKDFLNQSDLVKFAMQAPSFEEAKQSLQMLEHFIEVTKNLPNPESTEEHIA